LNNQEQEAPVSVWRIDQWFPDLSADLKSKLKSYHDELMIATKLNSTLVSTKTLAVVDALHFSDSILASRLIYSQNPNLKSITDFGSGVGFPGVVFALLYPGIEVTLVEFDAKKLEFLSAIVSKLKLTNVKIEKKTIETLPENSIQVAMTRGPSSISKSILSARKCVTKGGLLYHLKGEQWGIELGAIPTQLCSIWSPSLVGEYKLPIGAAKFAVIKTDKIA
jgi:16S rRNA (guanine527-N7)-methyltransferase